MKSREELIEYLCAGNHVYGVAHVPEKHEKHGLVAIGRYGAARLNVQLCRSAARAGLPAFRFDFQGRAWCEGPVVSVDETAEDIACAIRAFHATIPDLTSFTIMGLSEGAAAALLYAHIDRRIMGLVLVNPWIQMESEVAKHHLKMNLVRIADRSFWSRIQRSEGRYLAAVRSLARLIRNVVTSKNTGTLKDRVTEGLARFQGQTCIVLGGEDPATVVFQRATAGHVARLTASGRLTVHIVPEADHVFSRSEPRRQLIAHTVNWTLQQFVPGRDSQRSGPQAEGACS